MRHDIKSMKPNELAEYFDAIGERTFRSEQVFRWLHSGVSSFSEMTNLPEKLRDKLNDEFAFTPPEKTEKLVSKLDGTIKYLWTMSDGNTVESVLMEYEHGYSCCISTQVGCRMNCAFCASAIGGFVRNLTAAEMLDQIIFSQLDKGIRISNVVLMGIGEPLDNFENVMRFLMLITHPGGINIGARHITLSTCGIIENIDKLADYDIQLSLAVSLHAPDDDTRSLLMPVNKTSGVDELFRACERYYLASGRRISYEYAMIDGVNDTTVHADLLSKRMKHTGSHINLIRLNNVFECSFRSSPYERVKAFTDILKQKGVNFTMRRKLGGDIEASCGQLRMRAAVKREQGKRDAGLYGDMGDY